MKAELIDFPKEKASFSPLFYEILGIIKLSGFESRIENPQCFPEKRKNLKLSSETLILEIQAVVSDKTTFSTENNHTNSLFCFFRPRAFQRRDHLSFSVRTFCSAPV